MIKESTWRIKVLNPPHLNKQCSRCKNHKFYCSEKFRMNAQKKNIDIWLIYRCSSCDNTFNMTILSRTKSDLIDKGLFDKFSKNDKERQYHLPLFSFHSLYQAFIPYKRDYRLLCARQRWQKYSHSAGSLYVFRGSNLHHL